MAFRLYRVRTELQIRSSYSIRGPEYLVADPVSSGYFKIKYLQYVILRFLQERAASTLDVSLYLQERCDVEVEPASIQAFLEGSRVKSLLVPTRELKLSPVPAALLCRELKEQFRAIVTQRWVSHLEEQETAFFAEVIECLNRVDPVGAMEICQVHMSRSNTRRLAELFYQPLVGKILEQSRAEASPSRSLRSYFIMSFSIFEPELILRWIRPITRVLLSSTGLVAMGIIVVWAQILFLQSWRRWVPSPVGAASILFNHFIYIEILTQVSTAVHEFGHAMVCDRFGGKIRNMGVMLIFFLIPAAYADVTDSYFMPRNRRIAIMLAGAGAQLFLGSLAFLVCQVLPEDMPGRIYVELIFMINNLGVLFNLLPVFKLDGYYVLGDLVDIENLYSKSFTYCWSRVKSLFTGRSAEGIPVSSGREKVIYWIYVSLTSALFLPQIPLAIYIAPFVWDHRVLIRLILSFLGLVVIWVSLVTFLYSSVKKLKGMHDWRRRGAAIPLRPLAWLALIAMVALIPVPFSVNVSARLVPRKIVHVRARSEGLVDRVLIEEGDRVRVDQPLLELRNPILVADYVKERWHLRQLEAEVEARLAGPTAEERRVESLRVIRGLRMLEASLESYDRFARAELSGLVSRDTYLASLETVEQGAAELEILRASERVRLASPSELTRRIEQSPVEASVRRISELASEIHALRVTSSISGMVLKVSPQDLEGRYVTRGEDLLVVGSQDREVQIDIPEPEIVHVREGSTFEFLPIDGGKRVVGVIRSISPEADVPPVAQKNFYPRIFPRVSTFRVVGELSMSTLPARLISGEAQIDAGKRMVGYWMIWRTWIFMKTFFWFGF